MHIYREVNIKFVRSINILQNSLQIGGNMLKYISMFFTEVRKTIFAFREDKNEGKNQEKRLCVEFCAGLFTWSCDRRCYTADISRDDVKKGDAALRIDKLLSSMGIATRKEAASAARRGGVLVNGAPVKDTAIHIDPEKDTVVFCGRTVTYRKFRYIMLNKPEGYVSATEDGKDPTVLDLLPEEYGKFNLFPCGRLDKNTLGLMLITDNGELSHRLLSPKRHVKKIYAYKSKFALTDGEKEQLEAGVTLDDGYETKPAEIELSEDASSGYITLTEGKYHQIKRMFEAVHNKITYLERVTFGPLRLDEALRRGEWRELTTEEITALEDAAK